MVGTTFLRTTDTSTLQSVLTKTATIVEGVPSDQLGGSTPCPDLTVEQLRNHIVAWVRVFANGAAGAPQPDDPDGYRSSDPGGDFRTVAATAISAYTALPDDAPVRLGLGSMPAAGSVAMMTGEYVAHGWDLAKATGQQVPYTDREADAARSGLAPMLVPEYRGPGKPFGDIVEVPADASGLEKFFGFVGRNPR